MRRATVLAVLLALALAGCGGGGDKGGAGESGKTSGRPASPRFTATDVAFSFEYPRDFKKVDQPNDGEVLAEVNPTPGDVKNGIKIRKTSEKELPFASYSGQFLNQFKDQLGVRIDRRTERHSGLDVGVLEWEKAFQGTRLHSASYFFSGGGKTWQLECISDTAHRAPIRAACAQALGSLKFG